MYVSDIDEAQGADRTIIRITEAALEVSSAAMDNDFYIQILLESAEKAGRAGEAQRATEIIVDFVRSLPSSEANQAEYIPPFDQLPEPIGSAERLEAAIPRLLAAADLWREQGAPAEDRIAGLQGIPEPLRRRLLAEHLRASLQDHFARRGNS